MNQSCIIQSCYVGLRFLRIKSYPWKTLAIVPFKLLLASGTRRTHEKCCYMRAAIEIDWAGVYGLLNDLLW
ncbi:hypothetical protein IFO70_30665 [Phormidium tenue FACHB-886]|nr:hypothetical protein [Phormidium tenue FACHB-886]